MKATAKAPASCGELIEGMYKGKRVLVSLPINLYSTATVELAEEGLPIPDEYAKCRKALALYFRNIGKPELLEKISLTVRSDIPTGKGLAGSTADILAALCAAQKLCGVPLSPQQAAGLATQVEPSDSTMFPGLCLFDFIGGSFFEPLGQVPVFSLVLLEGAGQVDTIAQYGGNSPTPADLTQEIGWVKQGLAQDKLLPLASAARSSALHNQAILPKSYLLDLLAFAQQEGCVGVNIAHSGTVAGLWCRSEQEAQQVLQKAMSAFSHDFAGGQVVHTTAGGAVLL